MISLRFSLAFPGLIDYLTKVFANYVAAKLPLISAFRKGINGPAFS